MVKTTENKLFQCEKCDLKYREREWAEKCEAWCKEHTGSCNAEASAHAVEE